MRYARIINGVLSILNPNRITIGETIIYNPTEEQARTLGYKPFTDKPQLTVPRGYHVEAVITETEDGITRSWVIVQDPTPPPEEFVTTYQPDTKYQMGDLVSFGDGYYRLKTERALNIEPTDKTYWENLSLADLIAEIAKENEK